MTPRRSPSCFAVGSRRLVLRDDGGVIAVITAIVVAAVLVPVAALGLTAYVRAGVRGEMQRAAESGALAGAASLNLLNLGALSAVTLRDPLQDLTTVLPPALPNPLGPSGRACRAALTAYGTPLSDPSRDAADRSPLSVGFADTPACDARYSPDPPFGSCVNEVFTSVSALTQQIPARLLKAAGDLTDPVLKSDANDLAAIASAVQKLVPALAHNGVQVELRYTVAGPLDGVLSDGEPTAAASRAAARRLFKPILPDLAAFADLLGAPVSTGTLTSLTRVERVAVANLQAVLIALRILVDAAESGQTPDRAALMPYLDNTLAAAEALLRGKAGLLGLTGLLSPVLSILAALKAPVALPTGSALSPACAGTARDLLDDLSFALTINPDPADKDLLPCTVEHVLGPVPLTAPLTAVQSCVNRVFRAQLAPTT